MATLGIQLPMSAGLTTSGVPLTEFCTGVEALGADSIWTAEHVLLAEVYEPLYPFTADGRMPVEVADVTMPDPVELLAFIAASTRTLKLATGMLLGPLHSPAILAKRIATVDRLSNGRVLLGLGIGWHKEEFDVVGVPFHERGARLDDCIGAMREMWAGGAATYSGRFTSFDRVYSLQAAAGKIPIVLGGSSPVALRRAARTADGWVPHAISPADFADCVEALRAYATEYGRDPRGIEITVWPGSFDPNIQHDLVAMQEYVQHGASRIIYMPAVSADVDIQESLAEVSAFKTAVVDKLT